MKKVVAGAAVAAAIGAGAYGLFVYPQDRARAEVDKAFAALPRTMNAHHGEVRYSLFSDTLTLSDVGATIAENGSYAAVDIGTLTLRGLKGDSVGNLTASRITIEDKAEGARITAAEFIADEVTKGQDALFTYNEDGREWAVPSVDFKRAALNGITLASGGETVNVREILVSDLVRQGSAVTGLSLGIHGMGMDLKSLPDEEARNTFQGLGYDKLSLNFDLSFSHSAETKRLTIRNAAMGADEVGRLTISADIGGIPSLQNNDPMAALALAMSATLEKLELRYDDASLAGRVLKAAAKEQGADEAELKAQLIATLKDERESPTLSPLSRDVLDSALAFLENPKSLVLKADPPQPVPLSMLFMAASQDPDGMANNLRLSVFANK